jgi:hypothetical protein
MPVGTNAEIMPASSCDTSCLNVSWKVAFVTNAVSLRGKSDARCIVRRQREGTMEVNRWRIVSATGLLAALLAAFGAVAAHGWMLPVIVR